MGSRVSHLMPKSEGEKGREEEKRGRQRERGRDDRKVKENGGGQRKLRGKSEQVNSSHSVAPGEIPLTVKSIATTRLIWQPPRM